MKISKLALLPFALILFSPSCVIARDEKPAVKVSYVLPSISLSLHEPVILSFEIDNESKQAITVDLGQDRKGAFLFTVTPPNGTTQRLPQYRHEGISQYGNVSVQPGEKFSQRLVLNEWYDNFKIPGKYKLEARLTTPILVGEAELRDSEFKGEVSMTPRDSVRLEQVCARLNFRSVFCAVQDSCRLILRHGASRRATAEYSGHTWLRTR